MLSSRLAGSSLDSSVVDGPCPVSGNERYSDAQPPVSLIVSVALASSGIALPAGELLRPLRPCSARAGCRRGWSASRRGRGCTGRAARRLFEEGVSSARMYLDPVRPGVEDLIGMIVAGLRSSCPCAGARNLTEFTGRPVTGIQSACGCSEGMPVPASW
jgi:hypothetical protein